MCGIAGILRKSSLDETDSKTVDKMLLSIRHRGPDSTGKWLGKEVCLGSDRLAIVGIGNGSQPIFSEDGNLVLVCNGEIFNYVELRDDLKRAGHMFSTDTDIEVLLHLYEEKGDSFLDGVNGQFAFAIYDIAGKELVLARDRTGICPLFYNSSAGKIFFASEIKALFVIPEVSREFSFENIASAISFWSVPPPGTVFKNIFQLCPGEIMRFKDGLISKRRYWELSFQTMPTDTSFDAICESLVTAMRESVGRHLRADVPVGLYLSGGIDSSILAVLAAERLGSGLHTFSIGFEDENFDESHYQNIMANRLGTKHYHFKCGYGDVSKTFPDVVRHAETVLFRTAPVPLFYLSSAVHNAGYKTVTSGEGSDEIFWGYDTYRELFIRLLWQRVPDSQWRPEYLKKIFPYFVQYRDNRFFNFLKAFYARTLGKVENQFYSHLPRWETNMSNLDILDQSVREAVSQEKLTSVVEMAMPSNFKSWNHFRRCQAVEMTTLLNGYLLSSQGDRMIMAHSVEGRFPFLDKDVVSLASSIPDRWKCKGLRDKYVLREAFRKYLPKEICDRPKFAYRAPDMRSFFDPVWKPDYVDEMMSGDTCRKVAVFDPQKVELLRKKGLGSSLQQVSTKDNMATTIIISTHLLHHFFIDGR